MISVLKRPIVTEKMTALQEKGHYAFEVDMHANKITIAKAVEKKFNVTVLSVRTSRHKGKAKSQSSSESDSDKIPAIQKKGLRKKDYQKLLDERNEQFDSLAKEKKSVIDKAIKRNV